MRHVHSLFRVLAGTSIVFSAVVLAAPPAELPGAAAPEAAANFSAQPFDRAAALRERAKVHKWLADSAAPGGAANPRAVTFLAGELADIDNATGERPPRVGLSKAVSERVSLDGVRVADFRGRTVDLGHGAITGGAGGGFAYTTSVTSPGAAAMRLEFSGFDLPRQTGLYLYTEAGEVFGPYTGRGPGGDGHFWSNTVEGDTVIVQLHHVGAATDEVLRRSGFTISQVGHLRPRLLDGFCDFNASCVENAECGTDGAVTDAKKAVADMLFASGPYLYICTGGLLNDTASSGAPHFLTANHCISRGREASSLETFFGFTTECQQNTPHGCPGLGSVPAEQRTLGASISSTNRSSDYTLLLLDEPAPAGTAFLGWTTTPVANTAGTDLYRISHPGGAPQAYSEHVVDTQKVTCSSWPRGDWIYSTDTYGATEGGSSGSPVVNAGGQVVGQLSGACGYDPGNVCASDLNATVDGAFAAYYSEISAILDPGDPPACEPSPEVCDDGIDNDCDGFADELDTDCDGGGSDVGSPCVVGSDCLSGKCKGKPGAMTCK